MHDFDYERHPDEHLRHTERELLAAGVPLAWLDGEGVAIEGLYTPHGRLGYSLRRSDGQLQLDVAADAGLPPGGLVLPWPYPGTPGATTIDGKPAQWREGELRIAWTGASVRVAVP